MPVIREKRSYFTQPVGVVRAGADSFGVTSGIGELADSLIKGSYDTLVEEAKKKGQDLARTVKQSTFKSLNPETGQVEALKPPSTFGTAAANAYQELIETRYIASVEDEINNSAKVNFARYQNDRDGYAKFKTSLESDVDSILKSVDPRFSSLTESLGASLVASYESNFLTKKIEREQQDVINSGLQIIDSNLTAVGSSFATISFDPEAIEDSTNLADIEQNFESLQGVIDASTLQLNKMYSISSNAEVLNTGRQKISLKVGDILTQKLAEIAGQTGNTGEALHAKNVLLSGGKGIDTLTPPYRVFVEQALKLKINGNDSYINDDGEFVIEEGRSREDLLPLISDQLVGVINQSMRMIGQVERDAEADRIEREQEQNRIEIIALDEQTGPELQEEARNAIDTVVDSSSFADAIAEVERLEGVYSDKLVSLELSPNEIKIRRNAYRQVMLKSIADGFAFSGKERAYTNPANGKTMYMSDKGFNLAEAEAVLSFVETGGRDVNLLPEDLREQAGLLMEFAGADSGAILNELADKAIVSIQNYKNTADTIKANQIQQSFTDGTASPKDDNADVNQNLHVTIPIIEENFPDDLIMDGKGNKTTNGNIFLNPKYAGSTEEISLGMIKTGVVDVQLKTAFRTMLEDDSIDPFLANNIFNTMRQLDTQTDSNGRNRNILVNNLSDSEYQAFMAINAGVMLRGTENLSQVISDTRMIATDPDRVKQIKINRFGGIVIDKGPSDLYDQADINKMLTHPDGNELINNAIMQTIFYQEGITDARIQGDMMNRFAPYIDLHTSAGGDGEAIFDMFGVIYNKYYKPFDGIVVDPYNPASTRTTYSLANKRVGSDLNLMVTNLNQYFEDNNINAVLAKEEKDPFIGGSFKGMRPPTDSPDDIENRIFLMPFESEPFGANEETYYMAVEKLEDGTYEPFMYEGTQGLSETQVERGVSMPQMLIMKYSDIEEITFKEQDEQLALLEEQQIELYQKLREQLLYAPDIPMFP
jgi:hypothetical protein